MAILKIMKNNYKDLSALYNLIHYSLFQKVYDENDCIIPYLETFSPYFGGQNLYLGPPQTCTLENVCSMIYQQMVYIISYYGKDSGQLLHHFVLSFDTLNTESWVTPEIAYQIACQLCSASPLNEYQIVFGVHTNRPSHLHIHFIVNSCNPFTGRKLPDKKETYTEIKKAIPRRDLVSGHSIENIELVYE